MLITAHMNILESSVVSLSAGTEDPGFPVYRLHDRNIGRVFKPTAAETIEIKVDQGASGIKAIDRLLIPSDHSLDGLTLDIKHSDDDALYTPAVAQWAGASGVIDRSWAHAAHRYWKFIITTPGSIPGIPELFMSSSYEWPKGPARPAGPLDRMHNVSNELTSSGKDRFLVHGSPKAQRRYRLPRCGESQKDAMLELDDSWAGAKPFWLYDHTGQWIYGKLEAPLDITEVAYQSYSVVFSFLEVLP